MHHNIHQAALNAQCMSQFQVSEQTFAEQARKDLIDEEVIDDTIRCARETFKQRWPRPTGMLVVYVDFQQKQEVEYHTMQITEDKLFYTSYGDSVEMALGEHHGIATLRFKAKATR